MDKPKKILFVIHEASLTGAPLLAIDLIKLVQDEGYQIGVLLDRGGVIQQKFVDICPTFIFKHARYGKRRFFFTKLLDFVALKWRFRACKAFAEQYDIIFSNTIANGRLLEKLAGLKRDVITYVHELPSVVEFYKKTGDFDATVKATDRWAFPSADIQRIYKEKYNIDSKYILSYFKSPVHQGKLDRPKVRESLASRYQLPIEKLWVVGMGTTTKRKGVDLFLEVALELAKARTDMHFVWVGPYSTEFSEESLRSMVAASALEGQVSIIGPVPPNDSFLQQFDLFLLTSREDPYPLVVLEAAINKVPVVSFENGGIVSFLSDHCGYVTKGIDIHEMASFLINFDPASESVLSMKSNAYTKVLNEHLNKHRIHDQFVEIINCQ